MRLVTELHLRACHLGLRHGLHFGLFRGQSIADFRSRNMHRRMLRSIPRLTHPCLLAFISHTVEPVIVITNIASSALE